MIVHLKTTVGHDEAKTLAQEHQAILTQKRTVACRIYLDFIV